MHVQLERPAETIIDDRLNVPSRPKQSSMGPLRIRVDKEHTILSTCLE
jgi:hypothetical protein